MTDLEAVAFVAAYSFGFAQPFAWLLCTFVALFIAAWEGPAPRPVEES